MSQAPSLNFDPPKILEFESSTTFRAQSTLTLENPHNQRVAFKIKTTAPKSYLVKPSNGVIDPMSSVQVTVGLIPAVLDPASINSRFLVQSTFTDKAEPLTRDEWLHILDSSHAIPYDERKLSVKISVPNVNTDRSAVLYSPQETKRSDQGEATLQSFASRPLSDDLETLKSQYQDLLNYTVALDKRSRELATELDETQKRVGETGGRQATPTRHSGYEAWQVALIVIVAVAILRLARTI